MINPETIEEYTGFEWDSTPIDRSSFHDMQMNGPVDTVKYMKKHGIIPLPIIKEEKKVPVGISLERIGPVIRIEDFN